jgi:hypothetical protein
VAAGVEGATAEGATGAATGGALAAGAVLVEVFSLGTPGSAWVRKAGEAAMDIRVARRIGERVFRLIMFSKIKYFLRI